MKPAFVVPIIAAIVVAVVPVTLVTAIVLGPYTHANLTNHHDAGYTRTEQTEVGSPSLYWSPGLAVQVDMTAPMEERGKALFVARGCAGCHGMEGRGDVVGPRVMLDLEVVHDAVRSGPGGMPVYAPQALTDYDLTAITAYLKSVSK